MLSLQPDSIQVQKAILPRRVGKLKDCRCLVPAQRRARSPTSGPDRRDVRGEGHRGVECDQVTWRLAQDTCGLLKNSNEGNGFPILGAQSNRRATGPRRIP